MFFIPYAPNWVSKTLSNIWCSNTTVFCIDTFKQKWIFWTSPHWVRLIDTLSRLSINLSRRGESSDLQTPHNRSREKVTPTHTLRDRANIAALRKTSPSRNTRRAMRRWRRTHKNDVSRMSIQVVTHGRAEGFWVKGRFWFWTKSRRREVDFQWWS